MRTTSGQLDPADPLTPLLTRHSLGGKHLGEPGPDDAALARMVQVALRAPDHAGLVPWRLAVVRGASRERLGALFAEAARDAGKPEADAALDVERARRAPVTVALIARIDLGHPQVPAHEQWIAVGGALANFLNAAHLLGWAGKMLSGHKARHARVQAAFCGPGETLVGWITLGTPQRAVQARARAAAGRALMSDW
ncbi:MAG: nitroreductase [Burkholderiaceae bacterium]|nr:nitroreductase [Burkholderiaceae bacterium]